MFTVDEAFSFSFLSLILVEGSSGIARGWPIVADPWTRAGPALSRLRTIYYPTVEKISKMGICQSITVIQSWYYAMHYGTTGPELPITYRVPSWMGRSKPSLSAYRPMQDEPIFIVVLRLAA